MSQRKATGADQNSARKKSSRKRRGSDASDEQDMSVHSGSTGSSANVQSSMNIESDIRHIMGRKKGFWVNVFRGGGTGRLGRQSEMAKMMFLVLIPVSTLMFFTTKDVVNIVGETQSRGTIREVVTFSTEIGTLIHHLQRERDITALYLSQIGPETQMLVKDRYADTDSALLSLSMWSSKDSIDKHFSTKDTFHEYLLVERERAVSTEEIRNKIRFYSDVIDNFITWLYQSIQTSRGGRAWRKLIAYQMLVVAKEDAALERTLGSVFYAIGAFDTQEDFRWYAQKSFVGKMNFGSSQRFSIEVVELFHTEMLSTLSADPNYVETQIEWMRNQILYQNMTDTKTALQMSTYWYDNMTIYIDALFQVQIRLNQLILESNMEELGNDLQNLAVVSSLLGIVLLVAPFVIFSIITIIRDMQRFAEAMLEQTKLVDKERRRANSLVYQMLPKVVAKALKKKEDYKAERYETMSLFFTSIQGFHWLCGQISALEVVNLLNNVYRAFDKRIDSYDTYKIETVNDSYMVASGVPKRNGRKHLDEAAKCALDLHHTLGHLEVPGMPGVKMRLRIGMHTGSCVAGVVGTKMPRYCLFGDTINAASRMCSTCLPGQIQVSQEFNDFVKEFPGYRLDQRGEVDVKGKGNMITYWLVTKESLEKAMPCMPGCPIIQMTGGRIMLSSENSTIESSKSAFTMKL